MKRNIKYWAVVLCLGVFQAEGQQIFKISQYVQHNFIYNPAASGAADNPSVGIIYREMWSGIDGGPQTMILYGDKYYEQKHTGVSGFLYNDKTGPTSRTGGQINLSYNVELGTPEKRLMFGLGGLLFQYKIDKSVMINDPNFIQSDPIMSADNSKLLGDAAAGINYKSPTLNIGASVEQIIQSKLNFLKTSNTSPGQLYRNYFLMASYNLKIDQDNILIPNALLKYLPNAPVAVEGGVKLMHQDLIWIGFNYDYQQSYTIFAGVKLNHQFEIGYAFDQFNTPLNMFDGGSSGNELSLRYYFMKK
jgi:type IX secretion system PorP/SprF family membrane protein